MPFYSLTERCAHICSFSRSRSPSHMQSLRHAETTGWVWWSQLYVKPHRVAMFKHTKQRVSADGKYSRTNTQLSPSVKASPLQGYWLWSAWQIKPVFTVPPSLVVVCRPLVTFQAVTSCTKLFCGSEGFCCSISVSPDKSPEFVFVKEEHWHRLDDSLPPNKLWFLSNKQLKLEDLMFLYQVWVSVLPWKPEWSFFYGNKNNFMSAT